MLYGIDIFSGAGGLSLGAEMAGIVITHAIEIDPHAAASFKSNHKEATVHCGDIKSIDSGELIDKNKRVFVIMGGPPCQGFSMSNTMSRNMENPKNFLFKEFVRLVADIKPVWFVLENVRGLAAMEKGETRKQIERCFEELGYTVKSQILWAHNYGVPQKRNRLFIVGNLLNKEFEFPKPFDKVVTVGDAFCDLPSLKNGDSFDELPYTMPIESSSPYAQLMRMNSDVSTQNYVSKNNELVIQRYSHIKQGQNWRAIPESLMQNYSDKQRCHSGIYKRLKADEPSVVISNYRKMMLIHPFENRGLSVREAARLQSFPDNFHFCGPISFIQQQIGNAVPPLLAKAVFDQIIKQTESHG